MSTRNAHVHFRPALIAAIGLVFAGSPSAFAQVLEGNLLLRQSQEVNGWVNQVFPDYPEYSTGMGAMVTIPEPWWISNVQVFYIGAGGSSWYGNVNTAQLNVSRATLEQPDPAIDPTTTNSGPAVVYSGVVPVVLDNPSYGDLNFRMVADTSGIPELQGVAAGLYVFSLTGIAHYGDRGQAWTAGAGAGPSPDYIRNVGNGFSIGSDWQPMSAVGAPADTQWAIGINGAVPEPSGLWVIAAGLGLLARKRRR